MSVKYNGTYYYYLYNGQGDVVKLIDGDGVSQVEYTYDTWGACSVTGSLANTLGAKNPFRYRGYVYDTETRLYYLESRYYDPETGRFISADVYLSTNQGVLGNNAFLYCGNNPANCKDEEGEFWNLIAGTVIGAIIGGVTQVVGNVIEGKDWNEGLGMALASGAASGLLASTGLGVGAQIVGGAVIGAASNAGQQLVDMGQGKREEFSWVELGINTAAGAISGWIGGKGIRAKGGNYSKALKYSQDVYRRVTTTTYRHARHATRMLNKAAQRLAETAIRESIKTGGRLLGGSAFSNLFSRTLSRLGLN